MKIARLLHILFVLIAVNFLTACNETVVTYWPDGTIKTEITYDGRGEMHGVARWYFENGDPMVEANYKHGVLDGKLSRWMKGGIITTEDYYRDGKQHGKSIEWGYDGNKLLEQEFVNDTLHGAYFRWHPHGSKMIEGEYFHGDMHGQWLYWDVAGNVIARGNYEHGSGEKVLYSPLGNEIKRVHVENNTEIEYP
jgi:antitoxin component YwqK of YwqJK toxin-antitoxin module